MVSQCKQEDSEYMILWVANFKLSMIQNGRICFVPQVSVSQEEIFSYIRRHIGAVSFVTLLELRLSFNL